ncbi:complement C1q-like protein 3 [Haliotis rubra]|uniref:complement C1q-like protein 3 n=1 Tax=Haliotis rubra TaxID=36100 RepID=UPI001EE51960|nr:complement C1q-like protein 3 [Haliotis rubra]
MFWAVLFVCLLQPWSLSGIIMPNPSGSTKAPSLQNDITRLTQTIQSMQQQSAAEMSSLKAEIQAMKTELQQSSDELIQVRSELDSMKQNVSVQMEQLADLQSVEEQVYNLSETLASKTRDVAFHVSQLDGEQTTYIPLKYLKILYNSGDGYNSTSGTFTAPVSGTYMFWTQIQNSQANTYMDVWIMKTGRGDILANGWVLTDSTIVDADANAQTVLHLEMGEEVWVEITVEHELKDSDASYFGGVLLSVQ